MTMSGTPIISIGGTNADQFSVQAQPTSPVVASGSTTFTVRFTPTSAGAKSATIAIGNNDSDENPYNFTIQGNGAVYPEIDVQGNGQSIAIVGGWLPYHKHNWYQIPLQVEERPF